METVSTQFFRHVTIASALLLTGVLSGCKTSTPDAPTDASMNAALQSRLSSDPGLAGQPLQASVANGVATLSGSVASEAARSLAANDASQVVGIRTVVNNLSLGVPPTTPAVVVAPQTVPVAPIPERTHAARIAPPPPAYREPAPIDRRGPQYAANQQQSQADRQPPPPPPPAAPAFRNITVPSGTGLPVRVTQTLDSESTQPGTTFSGVIANDVLVDGLVAFPSGTRVSGRVDDAKDAGHFKGNSLLTISLTGITRRGENIAITTDPFTKEGSGRGKNTAEKVGGGAAVGAILGGIFGGGKGAGIGAAAGGGLGAGSQAVTRGQQVQIQSESLVRFRLVSAVTVRVSTSDNGNNNGANSDLQRRNQ